MKPEDPFVTASREWFYSQLAKACGFGNVEPQQDTVTDEALLTEEVLLSCDWPTFLPKDFVF